jgi:hypothetical protein
MQYRAIFLILVAAIIRNSIAAQSVDNPNQMKITFGEEGYFHLAPATGLEPVTFRLTAERSTTELRRNILWNKGDYTEKTCLRQQ